MRLLFSFFTSWCVLVLGLGLDFFSFDFVMMQGFVSSILTSFDLVCDCVTGFCWSFLSEIILDICELILSLLEFCVAMQCSDAITCVLESPSFLPLWGNQIQGNFYTAKKKFVKEMTVEVRFSGCPGCYLWNCRDFPYNRVECNVGSILLEYAASSS